MCKGKQCCFKSIVATTSDLKWKRWLVIIELFDFSKLSTLSPFVNIDMTCTYMSATHNSVVHATCYVANVFGNYFNYSQHFEATVPSGFKYVYASVTNMNRLTLATPCCQHVGHVVAPCCIPSMQSTSSFMDTFQ